MSTQFQYKYILHMLVPSRRALKSCYISFHCIHVRFINEEFVAFSMDFNLFHDCQECLFMLHLHFVSCIFASHAFFIMYVLFFISFFSGLKILFIALPSLPSMIQYYAYIHFSRTFEVLYYIFQFNSLQLERERAKETKIARTQSQ